MRFKIELPLIVALLLIAYFTWIQEPDTRRAPAQENGGPLSEAPARPIDHDAFEAFNTSSADEQTRRLKYAGPATRAELEREKRFLRDELKLSPQELERFKQIQDYHHAEARRARHEGAPLDFKTRFREKQSALLELLGHVRYTQYQRFVGERPAQARDR